MIAKEGRGRASPGPFLGLGGGGYVTQSPKDWQQASGHQRFVWWLFGNWEPGSDFNLTPDDAQNLVGLLDDRTQDMLVRWLGMRDKPPQTLRDIAEGHHVTIERVRQILQGKAVRKLRRAWRGR